MKYHVLCTWIFIRMVPAGRILQNIKFAVKAKGVFCLETKMAMCYNFYANERSVVKNPKGRIIEMEKAKKYLSPKKE